MDNTYKRQLELKYGIEREDAEIIDQLKKRIRKASTLTKEQKESCQVCKVDKSREVIYNHHVMKVEYLAILAYCYGLYKKVKNPGYDPERQEEANSEAEENVWTYQLVKDIDLYIPRIAICERHHNMLHELAHDFEGSTNKGLLKKAKIKELTWLYTCLEGQDQKIYNEIFGKNDSLEGREYYKPYLQIWSDTLRVSLDSLVDVIDRRIMYKYDEIGPANVDKLFNLRERANKRIKMAEEAYTIFSDMENEDRQEGILEARGKILETSEEEKINAPEHEIHGEIINLSYTDEDCKDANNISDEEIKLEANDANFSDVSEELE